MHNTRVLLVTIQIRVTCINRISLCQSVVLQHISSNNERNIFQVFNKIQNKLDLMSEIIDGIIKRYEKRCEKKKLIDENWIIIK